MSMSIRKKINIVFLPKQSPLKFTFHRYLSRSGLLVVSIVRTIIFCRLINLNSFNILTTIANFLI